MWLSKAVGGATPLMAVSHCQVGGIAGALAINCHCLTAIGGLAVKTAMVIVISPQGLPRGEITYYYSVCNVIYDVYATYARARCATLHGSPLRQCCAGTCTNVARRAFYLARVVQ